MMAAVEGLAEFTMPRMLQSQDGITSDSNCYIEGDFNVCPAQADFEFNGVVKRLTANLKCPFDAVAQSDFRDATQRGLCECDATILDLNRTDASPEALVCECFICPDSANQFGVAYTCESTISGPCYTFNCNGACNGDMNFISDGTKAPTAAPVVAGTDVPAADDTQFPMETPSTSTPSTAATTTSNPEEPASTAPVDAPTSSPANTKPTVTSPPTAGEAAGGSASAATKTTALLVIAALILLW